MKYVGLWLDHKKAVIIKWAQKKETTETLHSKLSPLYKARLSSRVAPKKQEDRREHVITEFYTQILKKITKIDRVYLMGPGLAKKEFKIFLKRQGFAGAIVEVANADKMTDRQVAAQARDYFGLGIYNSL